METPLYPSFSEASPSGTFTPAAALALKAKQFDDGLYAGVELAAVVHSVAVGAPLAGALATQHAEEMLATGTSPVPLKPVPVLLRNVPARAPLS